MVDIIALPDETIEQICVKISKDGNVSPVFTGHSRNLNPTFFM